MFLHKSTATLSVKYGLWHRVPYVLSRHAMAWSNIVYNPSTGTIVKLLIGNAITGLSAGQIWGGSREAINNNYEDNIYMMGWVQSLDWTGMIF